MSTHNIHFLGGKKEKSQYPFWRKKKVPHLKVCKCPGSKSVKKKKKKKSNECPYHIALDKRGYSHNSFLISS